MMIKIVKKVGLLAFACLLFIQAVIPAMAQPNLSGVDPNQPGTIRIHRFIGSTESAPTSGTPLNGVPYTIQLVRLRPDVDPETDDLRDPDNFVEITGSGAFEATESTVNGIASFTNLPHGIFLVTEGSHTLTPEGDRTPPFVVGIPRRSVDGESWIYEVDVYPKTEEDTIGDLEKELDLEWDSELEALVATWTLETTIPRLIGNATRFEFVDELDERLTFVSDSVVGTYLRMQEVEGAPATVTATLPGTAFTANVDSDNVLRIALTTAGFEHLSSNAVLAPEGTLTFTFRTTVSADAEDDFGELTNEDARLYYNDDETEVYEPPSETLFGIEVEKIDVNGDRLNGAVFELFLDEDGDYPAFPEANDLNRRFTATNGIVLIPNLVAGTYYLEEIEPPEGFRLISTLMQVTVSETTANPDRNYVVTVQVVNEIEDGFVLPETGGVGTILFTVFGLMLIGGAISLAIIARRRRRLHD